MNKLILKLLHSHDVEYIVTDGQIIADGENVGQMPVRKFMYWLGYDHSQIEFHWPGLID